MLYIVSLYNICYMKKPRGIYLYQTLYSETSKQRIVKTFLEHPEKEFSLSDLARISGVAKSNIGDILDELQNHDIINIEKLSKIWRIKANSLGWNFIKLKIPHNIFLIYQSGIIDFLNEYFRNPKAIVLFGSFRKGEDISTSDIDIAIENDEKGYTVISIAELNKFEKILGKKIQIHLFNRRNIDRSIFNNIANGIVISGFLEVKP